VEGFSQKEARRRGRPQSPFYWEPLELLTPPPGLHLRAYGEGWMEGFRVFAVYLRRRPRATSSAMSRTSGASWSWATSTFIMAMQKGQPVAMTSAPVSLSSL
jgi:hypothetical protein